MSRKAKDRTKERAALEDRIGHAFADKDLLDRALDAYFRAVRRQPQNRSGSYQRLEFLGDHVLGLVVSDMLFRAYPRANEGELSRRLADLVRKDTCAEVGASMDLGPALGSAAPKRSPAAARAPLFWRTPAKPWSAPCSSMAVTARRRS